MAPADWLDDPRVTDALDDAGLLFLAVAARCGPHVTPLAFDRSGRNLLLVTPRRSVKARAIARDRRVGGLVRLRTHTVLVGGRARLLDPLAGRGLGSLPGLPGAALGYLARNDRRVAGAVLDHPSPGLALGRVALRVQIDRVALFERGRLRAAWGAWPEPSELLAGEPAAAQPDLEGVPARLRPLLEGADRRAVLGWQSPVGPLALPASWDPSGRARVPTAALALAGALSAGPACLTFETSRTRLTSVRGLMIAGTGRAGTAGATTSVAVDPARITWWSGEDSGTAARTAHTLGADLRTV